MTRWLSRHDTFQVKSKIECTLNKSEIRKSMPQKKWKNQLQLIPTKLKATTFWLVGVHLHPSQICISFQSPGKHRYFKTTVLVL